MEVKYSVLQAELADMETLRNKLSDVEKSYRDLEASKEVSQLYSLTLNIVQMWQHVVESG